MNPETQIRETLARLSTFSLLDVFEALEGNQALKAATVRGFIMEALEGRHPEAFARWMEADGAPAPRLFFCRHGKTLGRRLAS